MTAADVPENHAEETDSEEAFGQGPQDEGLAGIKNYPPDSPVAVEDPNLIEGNAETRDDLATRVWRETGETSATDEVDGTAFRLLDTRDGAGDPDTEAELLSDGAVATDTPSAEEAALHIVEDPDIA